MSSDVTMIPGSVLVLQIFLAAADNALRKIRVKVKMSCIQSDTSRE